MIQERTDEFKYTFISYDVFASIFSMGLSFLLRFYVMDPLHSDVQYLDIESYIFFGILVVVIQVMAFILTGVYSATKLVSFVDEIGPIILGVILNLLLTFSVLFFFQVSQIARILPVLYAGISILTFTIGHTLLRRSIQKRLEKTKNVHKVIIVGSGRTAAKLAGVFETRRLLGFSVIGFVHEKAFKEGLEPDLGTIAELDEIIEKHRPHTLVFATGTGGHQELPWILDVCDKHGVYLKIVPGYEDLVTIHGGIESLDGFTVISIRDVPARFGLNRILKRGFDILFSLLFLVVFSPVFLISALLVKLSSKGPVFFIQERVGLDGKTFPILKFRTMRVQAQTASDQVWTKENDPRVTGVGKFLRKSSLDEFPQFLNVLVGQMSVVGPRPERPYYVEKFKDDFTSFKRRHAMKAGITGWAQISGLRGDTSIQDRIEADIYYIENWSFWLDLKIVLKTPFRGMFTNNAY